MVTIEASYDGTLRCTATHGPTSTTLSTDAPVDNEGRGESFSPTDLVATALASCAMTIMGIVGKREGIDLRGMRATVEKQMVADPTRRIERLPLRIRIPGKLTEAQQRKLETAAKHCPVAHSIRAEIDAPMTFDYPDL